MTQEEKELLIKDLCSRVSNGGYVKVSVESTVGFGKDCVVVDIHNLSNFLETTDFNLENVKVYLRPMSSMTDKEKLEYDQIRYDPWHSHYDEQISFKMIDWLDKKMFDYRGLIPMGLALEAPEDMYK